jgi:hypothetical protein
MAVVDCGMQQLCSNRSGEIAAASLWGRFIASGRQKFAGAATALDSA